MSWAEVGPGSKYPEASRRIFKALFTFQILFKYIDRHALFYFLNLCGMLYQHFIISIDKVLFMKHAFVV